MALLLRQALERDMSPGCKGFRLLSTAQPSKVNVPSRRTGYRFGELPRRTYDPAIDDLVTPTSANSHVDLQERLPRLGSQCRVGWVPQIPRHRAANRVHQLVQR